MSRLSSTTRPIGCDETLDAVWPAMTENESTVTPMTSARRPTRKSSLRSSSMPRARYSEYRVRAAPNSCASGVDACACGRCTTILSGRSTGNSLAQLTMNSSASLSRSFSRNGNGSSESKRCEISANPELDRICCRRCIHGPERHSRSRPRRRQHQRIPELHDLLDAIGIDDFEARQAPDEVIDVELARSGDHM